MRGIIRQELAQAALDQIELVSESIGAAAQLRAKPVVAGYRALVEG